MINISMESSHNYSMKDKLNANVRLEKRKQIAVNPIKKDNMWGDSRRNGIYIIWTIHKNAPPLPHFNKNAPPLVDILG